MNKDSDLRDEPKDAKEAPRMVPLAQREPPPTTGIADPHADPQLTAAIEGWHNRGD